MTLWGTDILTIILAVMAAWGFFCAGALWVLVRGDPVEDALDDCSDPYVIGIARNAARSLGAGAGGNHDHPAVRLSHGLTGIDHSEPNFFGEPNSSLGSKA